MKQIKHPSKIKYFVPVIWSFMVFSLIFFCSFLLITNIGKTPKGSVLGLYGSRILTTSQNDFSTEVGDSRVTKIEGVFEKFKCPLVGQGKHLVSMADEYQIPYWLVAAVSFQESGCGKKVPMLNDSGNSYNAWGYGIWGSNIKTFDSWEAGISAVSKYFGTNFYSKGITDPCEIMKVYTPPSKGSWCEGVKYFGELIDTYTYE